MVLAGPQLSEERRQPAARTAALHAAGAQTLLAEGRTRLTHVKEVGWVRSRAGDEQHWINQPSLNQSVVASSAAAAAASSSPSTRSPVRPHPALAAFQAEQARADAKAQAAREGLFEGRTSSSIYGAHTYARPLSEGGVGSGSAKINEVGAEQIQQQQSRLWGTLDVTSKRLGFGISNAPVGSALSALEAEQDRRRFLSVNAVSYARTGKERAPVISVPESMNRTTPSFPLQPVNRYSADRAKPKPVGVQAVDQAAWEEAEKSRQQQGSGAGEHKERHGSAAAAAQQDMDSTAHSLGYGRRHQFHRHYVCSAP